MSAPPPLRLITIGPSHYCEKARWALERARVPFGEEAHLPIVHWPFVYAAVGTRTVPALAGPGVRLGESRDILRYADERLPEGARLRPAAPELRAEVDRLEAHFDAELGPLARRLVYCHLVPDPALFVRVFEGSASAWERALLRRGHPALRAALGRAFKVSEGAKQRCTAKLRALFEQVSSELEGRAFLVGERFSAADLTFAALSSIVIFPDGIGPSLQELPDELLALVKTLRATPAGRHALRMYQDHRHTRVD